MSKYREIEKKFLVTKGSMRSWTSYISTRLAQAEICSFKVITDCTTSDTYWVPKYGTVQFIRVRDSIGTGLNGEFHMLKELTIKSKDRGNNFNRLETNVKIESVIDASFMLDELVGKDCQAGRIDKKDAIWFINTPEGEVVLSLALVENDAKLYFEVEGPTEEIVNQYCKLFSSPDLFLVKASFYELYLKEAA